MWKKILALLLLLIGGILIFSNQLNDRYISYQAKETIKEAMAVTPAQIKENTELTLPGRLEEERFDFEQVEAINVDETWQSILDRITAGENQPGPINPVTGQAGSTGANQTGTGGGNTPAATKGNGTSSNGPKTSADPASTRPASTMTEEQARAEVTKFSQKYIIGIIRIPSIKLELGVLKGVLNRNLYLGVGTMRKDQIMGQGNYPLAGHHTRSYGVMFNRVPELTTGKLMYLTDKKTIYTYRVYEKKKVHESEVSVIYDQVADQRGAPVLTLATCFDLKEPESRVIVHGELISSQPYTEAAFANLK